MGEAPGGGGPTHAQSIDAHIVHIASVIAEGAVVSSAQVSSIGAVVTLAPQARLALVAGGATLAAIGEGAKKLAVWAHCRDEIPGWITTVDALSLLQTCRLVHHWDQFNYEISLQTPQIEKIVSNCGFGDRSQNSQIVVLS